MSLPMIMSVRTEEPAIHLLTEEVEGESESAFPRGISPYRTCLSLCDGRSSGYIILPEHVPGVNSLLSDFNEIILKPAFPVRCPFGVKINNLYRKRRCIQGLAGRLLLDFYGSGDSSSLLRTSSSIRDISMEDISSFENRRSRLGSSGRLFSLIRPKTFSGASTGIVPARQPC